MLVIIGNIVGLLASIVMAYSGILKKKKKMLFFQCIEKVLLVISNLLKPEKKIYARNIVSKIILTVISIPVTIYFNNRGLIGLLPLIAAISFIWLMTVKDVKKFKLLIIVTTAMWSIYNFYIQSYVTFAFETLTIITNIISIIMLNKKKVKK